MKDKQKEEKKNKCVHTEHCCETCGCKYGDEDCCPVVQKWKKQSYPCGKNGVCNGY